MSSEDRFWLILTGIIASGICTLILGTVALCNYHTHKMASMGYEETVVLGRGDSLWQKPVK